MDETFGVGCALTPYDPLLSHDIYKFTGSFAISKLPDEMRFWLAGFR